LLFTDCPFLFLPFLLSTFLPTPCPPKVLLDVSPAITDPLHPLIARYYTQASHELDPTLWSLQKVGEKDVKNWNAWVSDPASSGLSSGSRVGIDGNTIDFGAFLLFSRLSSSETNEKEMSSDRQTVEGAAEDA
jgi:hypothetical protein